MDAFEAWFHAEIGSEHLEAFDGERITVEQAHGFGGELVGDDGRTLDVLWVALVELRGLRAMRGNV